MKYLWLIRRGPKPDYQVAPFHPVIICDRKRIAEWEGGWSGDKSWVWNRTGWDNNHTGWLLMRWEGLDIDYGHVVRGMTLPDGSEAGFWRDYEPTRGEGSILPLLNGCVWWSERLLPEWLQSYGVIYPPDEFSRQSILDIVADDGCSGFGRPTPPHWLADAKESHL